MTYSVTDDAGNAADDDEENEDKPASRPPVSVPRLSALSEKGQASDEDDKAAHFQGQEDKSEV